MYESAGPCWSVIDGTGKPIDNLKTMERENHGFAGKRRCLCRASLSSLSMRHPGDRWNAYCGRGQRVGIFEAAEWARARLIDDETRDFADLTVLALVESVSRGARIS